MEYWHWLGEKAAYVSSANHHFIWRFLQYPSSPANHHFLWLSFIIQACCSLNFIEDWSLQEKSLFNTCTFVINIINSDLNRHWRIWYISPSSMNFKWGFESSPLVCRELFKLIIWFNLCTEFLFSSNDLNFCSFYFPPQSKWLEFLRRLLPVLVKVLNWKAPSFLP